jgi:hypothetical protein
MPLTQVASLFRKVRTATRRPRPAGRPRLLLEQLEDRLTPSTALIPVADHRDLVFDATHNQLDITTAGGKLQRWDLATQTLLPATSVGTSLFGADITPDGASLYATDGQLSNGQAVVHKVNLANGTVTGLSYGVSGGEAGPYAIALGGNGKALFDGQLSGSGTVPLRQIDLTTDTLSTRSDDPGSGGNGQVRPNTMIYRSADRSLFFFTESGSPSGPVFDYDATAGTWSRAVNTGAPLDNAPAAVNRNGTLIALQLGGNVTVMDRTLSPVHTLTGVTGALEFDPTRDLLYVANGSTVTAYNTGTWAVQFSLPVGESIGTPSAFGNGVMAVSADGKDLFVATPTGVRELGLPSGNQLVVSGIPASTTAGASGSITVTVEDAGGHVLTGYTGTVHFTSSDGQAVLPADYTFTSADAGSHTFSNVVLKTAGAQSVSVTDNGSPPLSGGETNITVSPAAASSLTLSGLPMAATAGTPVSVTLTAKDAFGNVVTGYRGMAHFTSSDLKAVLPADYTFTSADAGSHAFSNVVLKTAGAQSVTASDGTLKNTANTTVVAGAASQLIVTTQPPAMVAPGAAFGLTVTAEDASGNVVTTFTGGVSVALASNPGGATLGGALTATPVNGVATFTGLTLDKPGVGYKLQATSSGLSTAITAAFDADSLSLSGGAVLEFRPVGTAVGTFSTTPGTGHTFTYTLVSGAGSADNGSFTLSGNQLLTADAFNAGARSSYSVRVRTTDERGLSLEQPFTITITNDPALALSNGTLTVTGTSGNDSFTFTPGAAQDSLTLNGKALAVDAAAVSAGGVVFNGNGGSDSATLNAGGGANALSLSPGGGTLSGPGYQVTVNKVGHVVANGHAGDRANLTGSPNPDVFVGTPTYAYLYDTAGGGSFFDQANGFGVVLASGGGGRDTAYLSGDAKAGGNVFVATPTYAYLRGRSAEFFNQANGFQVVAGTAVADSDQALLYGGGGSTFVGTPYYAYLYGSGPWEQANGFQYVAAHASGTGDTAYLYGTSAGGNLLLVKPSYSYLSGPAGAGRTGHFINYADGFQTVVGVAGSATDAAYLYGVPGNTLVATSAYAVLSGTGLTAQANGFSSVHAYSGGGGQAYLRGTMTAADRFVEGSDYAYLYGVAFLDFAGGFASVWANPNAHH